MKHAQYCVVPVDLLWANAVHELPWGDLATRVMRISIIDGGCPRGSLHFRS